MSQINNKQQQSQEMKRNIHISVRDLELNTLEDKPQLNDISCYLTVFTEDNQNKNKSNTFFDLLILSDPTNNATFKLIKGQNQFLKIQLKTLSTSKLIGSVTLNLSIFGESNNISVDQWGGTPLKQSREGSARIKMRFNVKDKEKTKKNNNKLEDEQNNNINQQQSQQQQQQQQLQQEQQQLYETERNQLNTTMQPCVNFPIKDEKRKYDFTPILNRKELEEESQLPSHVESRLVLTPERHHQQENSIVFSNKFQELIEKLMETKNQSLILGVTRQLNETHRKDLEKNNLTEILKRLNESQNYMEDDLLENPEQDFNNINLSLSGFHQQSKKQATPEQSTKRNKLDLEGEIASLKLQLEKKQDFEEISKNLKKQIFNLERNNETLLNQYNKAVDNYEKYLTELNEENHELKKKIAILEKDLEKKDKLSSDIIDQTKNIKQNNNLQNDEENNNNNNQKMNKSSDIINEEQTIKQYQQNQDIEELLQKHKQEISQYSQLLLEAQNESVQLQARMIEMQKDIDAIQSKSSNNNNNKLIQDISSNNNNQGSQQNIQDNQSFENKSNNNQYLLNTPTISKGFSEDDQAYFEKLIKEKSLKITQLEGEKAQADFINQKSENKIKQLQEQISYLEKQIQNNINIQSNNNDNNKNNNDSEEIKIIMEENSKLKTQIEESEQLRSTLEDHLIRTKQNFQKKIEELQQKQLQNSIDSKANKTKDESISMKKLVEELNQKSTFINELTYQNKDFKVKIQTLQEKIHILEFNQTEVEQLKKQIEDLDIEKEKINSDLYAVTEDLLKKTTESISQQSIISQLSNEIKRLEKMIEDLLLRTPQQQLSYNPNKGDEIDEKLSEFLTKNVTPIKFVRIEEGLYNFGTKRIIVKLLKGKLVCRVGGGFMVIEEFLQLYTLQELIKMKQTGDYSLLNYPISEEKIDQLIQQDIQLNQQQYRQLSNANNNNSNAQSSSAAISTQQSSAIQPSSSSQPINTQQSSSHNYVQTQSNSNYILQTQSNNNHHIMTPLRSNSSYNKNISIQQSNSNNNTDNYFQNYSNNQQSHSANGNYNNSSHETKLNSEQLDTPQQENNGVNYEECFKENQPIRSSYSVLDNKRQTPSRIDNSSFKQNNNIGMPTQAQDQLLQPNSAHLPIYNKHVLRHAQNNQQQQQGTTFISQLEERHSSMSQHERNQEMLKYLREQAQSDVNLRTELESLQNTIQMAANIKGSEIMRKYSQSNNTQQQTNTLLDEHSNKSSDNNRISTINGNQLCSSTKKSSLYPIDFTNSNYNYHAQNSLRNSINQNTNNLTNNTNNSNNVISNNSNYNNNNTNNSNIYNNNVNNNMSNSGIRINNQFCQKPPTTYSIRATPQKHSQLLENLSANTSAINEFTPQHINSKAATPKRNNNESGTSAYQERILQQYSHKRNHAENFSPYSHNKHSSITSVFSSQKKQPNLYSNKL